MAKIAGCFKSAGSVGLGLVLGTLAGILLGSLVGIGIALVVGVL